MARYFSIYLFIFMSFSAYTGQAYAQYMRDWQEELALQQSNRSKARIGISAAISECARYEAILFRYIQKYSAELAQNTYYVPAYFNHTKIFNTQQLISSKISRLQVDKAADLDEMRRGGFCTGCGLTRRVILSKGQKFPHPGQEIRAATQEELDRKAREYDDKISLLRKELEEIASAMSGQSAAFSTIHTRISEWNRAIWAERRAYQEVWNEEKQLLENRMYRVQERKRQVQQKYNSAKANSQAKKELLQALNQAKKSVHDIWENVQAIYRAKDAEAQRWSEKAGQDADDIRNSVKELTYANPFLLETAPFRLRMSISGPSYYGKAASSSKSW